MNESKYMINRGRLVNRETGTSIPKDEPVFILRAQDATSVEVLKSYRAQFHPRAKATKALRDAVYERILDFVAWQGANSDKVKTPD